MDKKTLIVGAIAVIALGYSFFSGGKTIIQQVSPNGQTYGSLAGPDIPSQYISVGGLKRYYYHQTMTAATTSICSFPAVASSTLVSAFASFDLASSTQATVLTIAKGTNTNATTTLIGSRITIPAGDAMTAVASTTPTAGQVTLFNSTDNLNFGLEGGKGTLSPTGTCGAVFEVYQ